MSFLVAGQAPDFVATAVMGDDSFDEQFSLSSLRGKHVVLFFYPLDFTFVCPSEILAFEERLDEFHERGCEVVGISVDSCPANWKLGDEGMKPTSQGVVDYLSKYAT